MGLLSRLFGKTPRISVLEVLAEKPNHPFTVAQIRDYSRISKRESYLILRRLASEGLVVKTNDLDQNESYRLNSNDLRSKILVELLPLINLGELESQIKFEKQIPDSELLPESILSKQLISPRVTRIFVSLGSSVPATGLLYGRNQIMESIVAQRGISGENPFNFRASSEGGEAWSREKIVSVAQHAASA